ncbi:MAG: 3,8-cyclase MoaA [Pseudomonadota bacterium]|jgi:cyclic pyranopterin phosphate synthase
MPQRSAIPIQPLGPKQGQQAAITRQACPLPPPSAWQANTPLIDAISRPLRDLRISVTDRCNFRCGYCMPREVYGPGHRFMPHAALLSFEEIERTSRLFLQLGVRKLRLTGGEPLMRKDLDQLVAKLAALRTLDGTPPEIALTTNGALLAPKAQALKDAGLQRITISLDALDNATFQRMSDSTVHVDQVLAGIDAALKAGLGPVKVNMVVQKGVNDDQIVPMTRHFQHRGVELRFIEYMDVGHTNGWRMDQVLPSEHVQALLQRHFEIVPASARHQSDTARLMSHVDGSGTLGFISSVTQAFCGDCNRLRLSTDGRLYTCLFTSQGHDLRAALRGDDTDDTLRLRLAALWQKRSDQYSALRSQAQAELAPQDRIEMSYIGG